MIGKDVERNRLSPDWSTSPTIAWKNVSKPRKCGLG
jgi:hypothetical protein